MKHTTINIVLSYVTLHFNIMYSLVARKTILLHMNYE